MEVIKIMTMGERIKQARLEKDMTLEEVGQKVGVGKSTVRKWENGMIANMRRDKIAKLADALGVSAAYLMGWKETTPTLPAYPNIHPLGTVRLPVLGEIACGVPRYASEDRESYTLAGTDIHADFCLIAHGDSMTGARIHDGDIVFIRKQDMVDNGDIAAVVIGDEATLKRFFYYREKELLILRAENPKYPDLIYTGAELEAVHVLGLAVAFQSDVQ